MKYRNRSVRCEHGFARDLVRCPACDDVSQYAHAGVKGNDYAVGYRRPLVATKRTRQPTAKRAYGYASDLGGGRQR